MLIMNADTDAQLAVTAAQAGAAVVRGMYGSSLARFEKSAGDFATAADIEAEKATFMPEVPTEGRRDRDQSADAGRCPSLPALRELDGEGPRRRGGQTPAEPYQEGPRLDQGALR